MLLPEALTNFESQQHFKYAEKYNNPADRLLIILQQTENLANKQYPGLM